MAGYFPGMTIAHTSLFRSAVLGSAALCFLAACTGSSSDDGGSTTGATGTGGATGAGGGASTTGGATTSGSTGGDASTGANGGSTAATAGGSGGTSASAGGGDGTGGETSGAGGTGGVTMIPGEYVPCSGDAPPELTLTEVTSIDGQPMFVTASNDPASTVIYIAQRQGSIFSFDTANPGEPQTVLESINAGTNGERGLLGMALHPDFDGTTNTRFFIYWTGTGTGAGESLVDEYSISGDNATFVANLFQVDQPADFGNHNGGTIAFGSDGYLYVGLGDGGDSNDQHNTGGDNNGQNPATPLGKMLRLDVDNSMMPVAGNLTAADVGGGDVDGRIIHWGLRNPFRFSFDRATGDLWIGDVGQNTTEEVDYIPAASTPQNLGWAALEGTEACPGCSGNTPSDDMLDPVHTYPRGGGGSVIGGYVYRGTQILGLRGRYIFADHNQNSVSLLTRNPDGGICDLTNITSNLGGIDGVVSFGEDAQGELYVLMLEDGAIYRIDEE
jgi:glucose/arabinose dehydrogenase